VAGENELEACAGDGLVLGGVKGHSDCRLAAEEEKGGGIKKWGCGF